MNHSQPTLGYRTHVLRSPFSFNRMIAFAIGLAIVFFAMTEMAQGQIDGFTQPYRKIELSSDEAGSIAELLVEEAQMVTEGEAIARLDARVQELQLEIANHMATTTSQLVAAEEGYKKRQVIANKLQQLKQRGHASESEIIRAEMELSIAKAKLLSAKEESAVRQIELRRAEVQLDRRTITAPFDGVIARLHSKEGEFLSPIRPEICTLVQVDRLIANFAVPSSQISSFEIDKEFNIVMADGKTVTGKVHSIGVETDAQSGTVEVKIVIENPLFQLRSGEICTLNI